MADIARLGFSVDTSGLVRAERAIESLDRASRGLRNISLSVDVSGAAEAMRQLDRLDGRNIAARVRVDLSGADEALRAIDRLSGGARSVRVDVAISGVDAAVRGLRDIERLAVNRTVRIDINTGDIRGAISDLERLAREARDAAAQINGLGANVNVTTGAFGGLKTVVGAVLGILAGGQIAQGINDVIQYNAEINLLTQSLGVSRDALQVWGNIGKSAGVDIANIFKDVNEKIAEFASTGGGEAVDVFKRLKLDVKDFIALSPDQQVLKITKAMSEMKDMSRGEKIFLLESLADDSSKLLPLLENNAAKLREIDQLTRSSGAIITAEQNANLTEAKGNLDKLALSMKGAGNAAADVGAQIVNAIAGDAMDAVSGLDDAIYRQAENVKIMADAWVYAYETASEAGHIYAADTEGWFTSLMEMERIGWTYLPVWAGAAYTAIDEKGRQWNLSAQAMVAQFRADWRNGMADMIDAAAAAYDTVANIAIKTGNNIFGGNTPEQHTVVQYATDLRAAAAELEGVAKARRYDAETAQYAAERAINSAAAYQVESEQRRTLNIEMGIAERQFAALGSGLESAGKSGQQFYVNQEKVNEALKDGGDKANDAKKQVDGLIDSLTKQRIELENGKLAAEYYTNRLNGLTDAEARAAAGAGQYNAYLAERKRQQQALAGIDGGIKSGYLAKLDDLGLTQTGSVFDAIREKTDLAVAANLRYRESLKGTGAIALKVGEQLSGQFDSAFKAASNATGVEEAFLRAVAMQETGYLKTESARTSAVSPKGALGVMQVLPETGARMGYSVADLRDASKNIMAGATYLADQIKSFGGNKALAAAAYNAGPNRQSLREGRIPNIPETQNYVPRVLGYYEQIKGTVVATNAELAKSVPYWDTLTTSTGKVADSMGVYSGQFDNARVTAGGITGLINTELQIATNGLLKTASDHTAEVTKTGYEYRQMQLAQMQLEPQMQAMVLAGESQAAYAEQYNALLRERAEIKDPSAIGGYKRGLSDQTLDKSQIEALTGLKLQNTFDQMSAATARQRQEALMSVDAWRLQQLTLETGLTPAMAQHQLQFEQQATHAQKWREITDDAINGVADGLTNAAMGMETDWSGVINKMIAETIKLNTIQPMLKSFFGIFGIATPFADGGAFGGNGVQAYANGGAFHNSVLTKPTQFFANGGLAVAGEDGAEAVMPLTRIGGRLGVQAVGAGAANVTVQNRIEVINKADTKVTTKESSNPDGSMSLQILIEPLESMISDRARRGMGLANTFRTVG